MASAHRVGILSDTHGRLDDRVLDRVAGCDTIIHAGDVGSTGVLDALVSTGATLVAVKGNNDVPAKWSGELERLEQLVGVRRLELPGGALVVVHGDRVLPAAHRHARLRACYPDARLVIYGHSHRLVLDRDARPWVVNPGAAGQARTYGGPSACILVASPRRWTLRAMRFAPIAHRRSADAQR